MANHEAVTLDSNLPAQVRHFYFDIAVPGQHPVYAGKQYAAELCAYRGQPRFGLVLSIKQRIVVDCEKDAGCIHAI